MNNLFGIVVSIIYIGVVIASAKAFEKAGKEASRKFIHIMLSNWWIIAMIFFKDALVASILPALFIVINYLSYKKGIISVMERDEGEENKESMGTVFYAVSLFILTLITFGPLKNPIVGLCGIFVMGYGDGFAAVIGTFKGTKYTPIGKNLKSKEGTFTMLVATFSVITLILGICTEISILEVILYATVLSIVATLFELFTPHGLDNLTVPLGVSLIYYIISIFMR